MNRGKTQMANIVISELRSAGSELFQDSETFMNDLTEEDMINTLGGQKSWSTRVCQAVQVLFTADSI